MNSKLMYIQNKTFLYIIKKILSIIFVICFVKISDRPKIEKIQ